MAGRLREVTASFDAEMIAHLDLVAARTGVARSEIIRRLVARGIAREQRETEVQREVARILGRPR